MSMKKQYSIHVPKFVLYVVISCVLHWQTVIWLERLVLMGLACWQNFPAVLLFTIQKYSLTIFLFVQSNTKIHTLLYLRGMTTVIFSKVLQSKVSECSSLQEQLLAVIMKLWLVNNEGIAFRFKESEALKWQILRRWQLVSYTVTS